MSKNSMKEGISIIIPLKVTTLAAISGFKECYTALLAAHLTCELIIVDQSSPRIFAAINKWFTHPECIHIRLPLKYHTGLNNKMNAQEAGIAYAKYNFILLLDDDFRPTVENIQQIVATLRKHESVKCMSYFAKLDISSLATTSGMLIENLLYSIYHDGYSPCHLAFHKKKFLQIGMPDKNVLFDDLALYRHFDKHGGVYWEKKIFLQKVTQGIAKFLEQRIRYAYEYLAYPIPFIFFLIWLPVLLFALLFTFKLFFLVFLLLNLFSIILALFAHLKFRSPYYFWYASFFAPVWTWGYAIGVWFVPLIYLIGGYRFGEKRIQKVI